MDKRVTIDALVTLLHLAWSRRPGGKVFDETLSGPVFGPI
jgi:hypothetical protein